MSVWVLFKKHATTVAAIAAAAAAAGCSWVLCYSMFYNYLHWVYAIVTAAPAPT
jgi:hypothetical protein